VTIGEAAVANSTAPDRSECEKWAKAHDSQAYRDITHFWDWLTELIAAVDSEVHLGAVDIDQLLECVPELTVAAKPNVRKFWNWLRKKHINYEAEPEVVDIKIDDEIYAYFRVDTVKLEEERRALLEHQRALNEAGANDES
jgi:hypothetical protein